MTDITGYAVTETKNAKTYNYNYMPTKRRAAINRTNILGYNIKKQQ